MGVSYDCMTSRPSLPNTQPSTWYKTALASWAAALMEEASSTVPYNLKILLIGDNGSDKRQLLYAYLGEEEYSDTTTLG